MTVVSNLSSLWRYGARSLSDLVGIGAFILLSGFVSDSGAPLLQFIGIVAISGMILVTASSGEFSKLRLAAASLLAAWVFLGDPLTAPIGFAASWCVVSPRSVLARSALVAGLLHAITPQVPELRVPLQTIAALISRIGADGLNAGPTALGIQSWAILILAALAGLGAKAHWRSSAALIFLSTAAVIWHSIAFVVPETPTSEGASVAFAQLPPLLFALSIIGACFVPWEAEPSASKVGVKRMSIVAFAFVGVTTAGLLWSPLTRSPSDQTKVCVWNEGGLDWNRPHFGDYDSYGGGMFGMLPLYLEQDNVELSVASGEALRAEDLAGMQVLVLINCQRSWSDDERRVIREFMEGGGSTLVLGDHTNVFGLQEGLNSLLTEYGIKFRFDSAYPLARPMQSCTSFARHPVTRRSRTFKLAHSIGASLECAPSVCPLAVGNFVFSDTGYAWNVQGSFLGNYSYEGGELIGDVDLVVWRDVGRGKLCVYGDTSALQNGGLVESYQDHVLPLFRWLAQPASLFERRPARLSIGMLWLLAAAYGLTRRSGSMLLVSFAGGVCVALFAIDLRVQAIAAAPSIGLEHVVIDRSSIPLTGHYSAKLNDIGPLFLNLRRAGFLGIACDRERINWQAASAIVFIDPTREFELDEVDELMEYQRNGGKVILCIDGDRSHAARPLLERYGVEVTPVPLGPVPQISEQRRGKRQPRMLNAWPIQTVDESALGAPMTPLIKSGDHVTAAFLPQGTGGLILIADARFFCSRNIEGSWGHWPGSVQFIYLMLRDFLGADPSEVADVFPSPEKPR